MKCLFEIHVYIFLFFKVGEGDIVPGVPEVPQEATHCPPRPVELEEREEDRRPLPDHERYIVCVCKCVCLCVDICG